MTGFIHRCTDRVVLKPLHDFKTRKCMLSSEIELNKYSYIFSNKFISHYGVFSSKFLRNVRKKRKSISFSEHILESKFLIKCVRPVQSSIFKLSVCRYVSGFKHFQILVSKEKTRFDSIWSRDK